jgi:hypothetical protein
MGQISESYASPGLRLGLLLEDHPGAIYDFDLVTGTEVGIPEAYGGDRKFCLCTIRFPGPDRADVTAWKPVGASGSPDEWNVLCTKTLGRALKRAGYPDDLKDLKALVLWRQRTAEIGAIEAGTAQLALAPASQQEAAPHTDEMQRALSAAAVATSGAVGSDDRSGTDEDVAMLLELVAGLEDSPVDKQAFEHFCDQIGVQVGGALTQREVDQLLGWFDDDDDMDGD